jgi:hypothetical protein
LHKLKSVGKPIDLVERNLTPIQVISDKIFGEQYIIVHQDKLAYSASSQHGRNLASHRAATNDGNLTIGQLSMILVEARGSGLWLDHGSQPSDVRTEKQIKG